VKEGGGMKSKSCMKMKKIHLIVASAFVIGLLCSLAVTVDAYTWYTYGGHEYALTKNYNNWSGAEAEAVSQGGHLATITDQNQSNFLINTFQNTLVKNGPPGDLGLYFFWIGLYNTSGNLSDLSAWQWISGNSSTFWKLIRTHFWGWYFPGQSPGGSCPDPYGSECDNGPYAYLHTKPHPYPGTINNDIRWDTHAAALGVIERISAQWPSVFTGPATNMTQHSATLNGTINPSGLSTIYYFQFGTTTFYGNATSNQSAGSGTSNVAVSANLTGLASNTTYHYRLVAINATGTIYGSDMTFKTLANPLSWLMMLLGN
jgi:hypothetical protein